jgi:GTP-binding protein
MNCCTPGEVITIAKGGDGGFGTCASRAPINRAPRRKPLDGRREKEPQLELKVLADVGLLGCPTPASRR